jgi:uncharacterized membrane protein YhaH (DUF805 family)
VVNKINKQLIRNNCTVVVRRLEDTLRANGRLLVNLMTLRQINMLHNVEMLIINQSSKAERSEFFAALLKIQFFWDVMLCQPLGASPCALMIRVE